MVAQYAALEAEMYQTAIFSIRPNINILLLLMAEYEYWMFTSHLVNAVSHNVLVIFVVKRMQVMLWT